MNGSKASVLETFFDMTFALVLLLLVMTVLMEVPKEGGQENSGQHADDETPVLVLRARHAGDRLAYDLVDPDTGNAAPVALTDIDFGRYTRARIHLGQDQDLASLLLLLGHNGIQTSFTIEARKGGVQ